MAIQTSGFPCHRLKTFPFNVDGVAQSRRLCAAHRSPIPPLEAAEIGVAASRGVGWCPYTTSRSLREGSAGNGACGSDWYQKAVEAISSWSGR